MSTQDVRAAPSPCAECEALGEWLTRVERVLSDPYAPLGAVRAALHRDPELTPGEDERMSEPLTTEERATISSSLAFHVRPGLARVQAVDAVTAAVEAILAARLADQAATAGGSR